MNIYKFITPSDPITFKAENDKIAYACVLFLGNGKAGCENCTSKKSYYEKHIFKNKIFTSQTI